jgi:[acyl-carrier-protein] S-malonyltransferase
MELCLMKGAKRAVLLSVSAPFHCSLLKPAGERLEKELENVMFMDFKSALGFKCYRQCSGING